MKNNPNLFSDKPKISVIIVNYRSWKDLTNCLNSLVYIVADAFVMEVIVIDNFSNDGLFQKYQQKFATVNFIKNSGNNGFANGCNVGAKNATGNYLLFLNPDTIASKEALLEMLNLSKNNDDYGIVSCSQINPQGKKENEIRLFPSLETLFGITRAIYKKKYKNELNEQFEESKEIIFPDWVSGSVIFMSKSWFNKVKGWNEDFWMYFEDVDLCKRVTEANGKIVVSRNAKIIHNHGGASRLNINTSAITKTEVIISKHVYINLHFKGFYKNTSLFLLIIFTLLSKLVLGGLGLIFYPIPKMRLQFYLCIKIINYYLQVIYKGCWIIKKL